MDIGTTNITNFYPYQPSHVLPAVFAGLIGLSLIIHIWENFRYKYWRVTFFMFYGGVVFTAGWIMRIVSSYHTGNINFYIAQTVLVLAGPPIYSAAEYNVLGRLMHYLPMHAMLNPNRVIYFFVYLGALVEGLTAAGGARLASAGDDKDKQKSGALLVAIACVFQAVVECLYITMITLLHRRVSRANMLTRNVRNVFIMLYGTSLLIFVRCIFRAVEKFAEKDLIATEICTGLCRTVVKNEWYLYAFEAAPMVLYTYWLNIIHPGRFLPSKANIFLDYDMNERVGPGWKDNRPLILTFVDPFDMMGWGKKKTAEEKYWERPDDWPLHAAAGGATTKVGQAEYEAVSPRPV